MERAARVAALYDVHGNLPALEAVLSDLGHFEPDLIVVGGDVASGPMPAEVLERLEALGDLVRWVRGNTDRQAVSAYDGGREAIEACLSDPARVMDGWAASRIEDRHRDLLASFPGRVEVEIPELGDVLFCHATPPNGDEEIVTTATPDVRLRGIFAGVGHDVVVCGHVHTQYYRRLDDKRVVNAGSVGLPYQGEPVGAFWALLGPGVELRRSDYDLRGAIEGFRAVSYPAVEDFAESLLEPPDPDWVADLFERQADGRA